MSYHGAITAAFYVVSAKTEALSRVIIKPNHSHNFCSIVRGDIGIYKSFMKIGVSFPTLGSFVTQKVSAVLKSVWVFLWLTFHSACSLSLFTQPVHSARSLSHVMTMKHLIYSTKQWISVFLRSLFVSFNTLIIDTSNRIHSWLHLATITSPVSHFLPQLFILILLVNSCVNLKA